MTGASPATSIGGQAAWRERLAVYRTIGDPEVDVAIAAYRSQHPTPSDLRTLVRDVVHDLERVRVERDDIPAPLRGLPWTPPELPAWAHDHALIERGQAVFNERGLEMGTALVFAALPMGYAAVHGGVALSRTSDLATRHLTRRVAETGQMLIDVMGTRASDCLDPGGTGHASAVGLRLMHGCVRALLIDDGWPTGDLGVPLSQEMMLATLLDFTLVTWTAMERMGIDLPAEDRRAHLYTWSVVGATMGIDACRSGPLSLVDADEIGNLLQRTLDSTPGGQQLMAALLAELEDFMPLGLRKLPRSLVHWLFADAPGRSSGVPGLLAVPAAAWWSDPVFSAVRAANRMPLPRLLRRVIDRLTHRAGRLVVVGFADGFAREAPPFRVPPELRHAWGLRSGRASTRVRAARHGVRVRIRTLARVRRGDAPPGP